MIVDANGNIYITGNCEKYTSYIFRASLIKYNNSGNVVWIAAYPQNYSTFIKPHAIALDNQGNVIVALEKGLNNSNILLLKYNPNGSLLWNVEYTQNQYTIEVPRAIDIGTDGSIYLTGECSDSTSTGYNFLTMKYNSTGVLQWMKRYDGPGHYSDLPVALKLDINQNVIVAGSTSMVSTGNKDYCTIKYNSQGVQQWIRTTGFGPLDEISDMTVDTLGNIYVTGSIVTNSNQSEYCTIKYNASGTQQWAAMYAGINGYIYNISKAIDIDRAGNVYVTGYTEMYYTLEDYCTIKYSPSGTELWKSFYNSGTNSIDVATDMKVDKNGNCYITGYIQPSSGKGYMTIKYNTSGVQQWGIKLDSSGVNALSYYPFIQIDNNNFVYAAGTKERQRSGYVDAEIVLAKYSQLIGINNISTEIPSSYNLYQNYPNPFNPATKIQFQIPLSRGVSAGRGVSVKLAIYDILGKEIAVLVNEFLSPGTYEIEWNASDYPSGVYFYRLVTDGFTQTNKMILVK